jgi:hypothetical protein
MQEEGHFTKQPNKKKNSKHENTDQSQDNVDTSQNIC